VNIFANGTLCLIKDTVKCDFFVKITATWLQKIIKTIKLIFSHFFLLQFKPLASRNFEKSTLRFQMHRNCQRYNVENVGNSPEWTDSTAASVVSQQLLHLFAQYEYTFDVNKHCVPNMVKLVTWHGRPDVTSYLIQSVHISKKRSESSEIFSMINILQRLSTCCTKFKHHFIWDLPRPFPAGVVALKEKKAIHQIQNGGIKTSALIAMHSMIISSCYSTGNLVFYNSNNDGNISNSR
jgi:hypothetical protein